MTSYRNKVLIGQALKVSHENIVKTFNPLPRRESYIPDWEILSLPLRELRLRKINVEAKSVVADLSTGRPKRIVHGNRQSVKPIVPV